MKRRVSAPTTLPWRTRKTVVVLRAALGVPKRGPGQQRAELGQLDDRTQHVPGEATQAPRHDACAENHRDPGQGRDCRAPLAPAGRRRARCPRAPRAGPPIARDRRTNAAPSPSPGVAGRSPHADQQRRRASDHRREDQQTAADRIREIGHGGDHEEQEEDQTRGAEHADAAIAHDGETLRLIPPGEPVQDVGEPIEVDAAGHRLPCRDQEGRGQERREESLKDDERAREAYAQQEADDREPPTRRGPSAETPCPSRPGTGTTVKNRTARISDPMRGERRPRRSDGLDGIASRRELELLGFRVGEAPDQLVAQLGPPTMPSTSISDASL